MTNYPEFHDGLFEGMWIAEKGVLHLYLSTLTRERMTVVLTGVVMLKVTGFREGNIIFDVLSRDHSEMTLQHIAELYELEPGHEPAKWEHQLLERARNEGLQLFELNPSYGGYCLVLAKTLEFTNHPRGIVPR